MSKLDELLDEIYQTNPNDSPVPREMAKAVWKSLMLELIGEDETSEDLVENDLFYATRNGLKSQLRQKVKSI